MTNHDIIWEAVKRVQGRQLRPGDRVCHPNHRFSHELLRYEGDIAVCELFGVIQRWPASEVFSPNDVKHEAVRIRDAHIAGLN